MTPRTSAKNHPRHARPRLGTYADRLSAAVADALIRLIPPNSPLGILIGTSALLARTAWRAAKVTALITAIMGAVGFAEFIAEEALQTTGIAISVSLRTAEGVPQRGVATAQALNSYLAQLRRAAAFHARYGWLSPITETAYDAYFNQAAPLAHEAQLAAASRAGLIAAAALEGVHTQRTSETERLRAAGLSQDEIEETQK